MTSLPKLPKVTQTTGFSTIRTLHSVTGSQYVVYIVSGKFRPQDVTAVCFDDQKCKNDSVSHLSQPICLGAETSVGLLGRY
jgi:hypothetical protein